MHIILAQLNFTVGDISGNTQKIIDYAHQTRDTHKADLIVFPELALTGYPPEDLLLRDDFNANVQKGVTEILKNTHGIAVIFGYSEKTTAGTYNKAMYLCDGKILDTYSKQILPNYGVFDEKRYFNPGNQSCVFTLKNTRFAILICEDLWDPEPVRQAVENGAECIIALNASPFDRHKANSRENMLRQRCTENNTPIAYLNTIGGQDELVFDGGSLFMDAGGQVQKQACFFKEELLSLELTCRKSPSPTCRGLTAASSQIILDAAVKPRHVDIETKANSEALIHQALVLATRDYAKKNNFKRALLGLSGGIDSALVAAIAVDALGKENVETIMMPSRYTAQMSIEDANKVAVLLGIQHTVIEIEPLFTTALDTLAPLFSGLPPDITEENMQARARGLLLMALSNKKQALVLACSNKSEMAVGYSTLYGDMVGGFCVLKDVYKTMVYRLAHYRNALSPAIPERILQRPPSAELAPNQSDQDSLPPYPVLDAILERYIEGEESAASIIAAGFDEAVVHKVIKMICRSEYKRRQAPPGPRVTTKAFGRDRRYPG